MKFRKKPVVIEAIRLDKISTEKVVEFMGGEAERNLSYSINNRTGVVNINTAEGMMRADPGDWIIKEPFPTGNRKFYPCKPDIFEMTYEAVEP